MSWKDLFRPIKDVDPNDPKNKDLYEKSRKVGENTARFLRLNKVMVMMQGYANRHPKSFLVIAFGIPIFFIVLNLFNTTRAAMTAPSSTAIEKQHMMMREIRKDRLAPVSGEKSKPILVNQTSKTKGGQYDN